MEYSQQCARLPKATEEREQWERAVIVLEHCPLMSTQTDRGWELVCQRHRNALARKKVSAIEMRPDVVHQVLLHLLDCPLSRAGKLQVYLHTIGGVLIAVDPRLRVPRSYRLFEKMIVSLLHKMKIRSTVNSVALMKVVKNPITDHLPTNSKFIRVEVDGVLVDPFELCRRLAAGARPQQQGAIQHAISLPSKSASSKQGSSSSSVPRPLRLDGAEEDGPMLNRMLDLNNTKAFRPFVFVIGGTARGHVAVPYAGAAPAKKAEKTAAAATGSAFAAAASGVSTRAAPSNLAGTATIAEEEREQGFNVRLSMRSMSAAAACSVLCHALEEVWLSRGQQ